MQLEMKKQELEYSKKLYYKQKEQIHNEMNELKQFMQKTHKDRLGQTVKRMNCSRVVTENDYKQSLIDDMLQKLFQSIQQYDTLSFSMNWSVTRHPQHELSLTIVKLIASSKSKQRLQWLGEVSATQFKRKSTAIDRLVKQLLGVSAYDIYQSDRLKQIYNHLQGIATTCNVSIKPEPKNFFFITSSPNDESLWFGNVIPTDVQWSIVANMIKQIHPIAEILFWMCLLMIDKATLAGKNIEEEVMEQQAQMIEKEVKLKLEEIMEQQENKKVELKNKTKIIEQVEQELKLIDDEIYAKKNLDEAIRSQHKQIITQTELKKQQIKMITNQIENSDEIAVFTTFVCYFSQKQIFQTQKRLDFKIQNSSSFINELFYELHGFQTIQQIIQQAIQDNFILQQFATTGDYYTRLNDRKVRSLLSKQLEHDYDHVFSSFNNQPGCQKDLALEQLNYIPMQTLALIDKCGFRNQNIIVYSESIISSQQIAKFVSEFVTKDDLQLNDDIELRELMQNVIPIESIQKQLDAIQTYLKQSEQKQEIQPPLSRSSVSQSKSRLSKLSEPVTPKQQTKSAPPQKYVLIIKGDNRDLEQIQNLMVNRHSFDGTNYFYRICEKPLTIQNYYEKNYELIQTALQLKIIFVLTEKPERNFPVRNLGVEHIIPFNLRIECVQLERANAIGDTDVYSTLHFDEIDITSSTPDLIISTKNKHVRVLQGVEMNVKVTMNHIDALQESINADFFDVNKQYEALRTLVQLKYEAIQGDE
ncbi:Conserved_hypothetical protein [Hexamita inflata]|uniref:Uncharacterized protein n=1 Tax=Hexamita inflata TaxID=28002 RepID=A0AA86NJL9_9EUKA|nr:Conserved hypothetical protein [Hexamita inflata]